MAYDHDLADRLREVLAAETGLTEKAMFGGLAFLIDGHMAVSASGQGGLLLRVDPADTDELVTRPHAARVPDARAADGRLAARRSGGPGLRRRAAGLGGTRSRLHPFAAPGLTLRPPTYRA